MFKTAQRYNKIRQKRAEPFYRTTTKQYDKCYISYNIFIFVLYSTTQAKRLRQKRKDGSKSMKKTFKNKVWAYSDGDTLYVNGRNFNVQQGYACAVADGQKYLSISAATSGTAASTATVTSAVAFGLTGAAFMGSAMADVRYYYAIDKTTGKLHLATININI